MTHDFTSKLEYSLGEQQKFDIDILKEKIPGCVKVEKTTTEVDKTGVDYIATLRRGAEIFIDAKTREKGALRYWKLGEPELALEIWSAVPTNTSNGKTGWTLDESSAVDYILYTFDKSDTDKYFFLPFQLLRTAFYNNFKQWTKQYCIKRQYSNSWQSEAIFVPASVVLSEIRKEMELR